MRTRVALPLIQLHIQAVETKAYDPNSLSYTDHGGASVGHYARISGRSAESNVNVISLSLVIPVSRIEQGNVMRRDKFALRQRDGAGARSVQSGWRKVQRGS